MTKPRAPEQIVRLLVAEAAGSAPREAGALMWAWADGIEGTIGGGALELEAITAARAMLEFDVWHRELRTYPLGPALGQCCGGMVRVLFEVVPVGPGALHSLSPFFKGERVGVSVRRRPAGYGGIGPAEALAKADPHPSPLPFAARARRGEGESLLVRPILPGVPPAIVRDRSHTADWPLPVLRAVRQMLSGTRRRETLLIHGGKRHPAYVIEPEARPPHTLYLYGAGHVGRAVVRALEPLPFAITWVDIAAERFPAEIPELARPLVTTDPAAFAAAAPPDALHLIMTFSHALDLAISRAVLARPFAWAGLIGSATKRARFEKRLRESGISDAALARLACPIGIGGITGKEPAMIAVSVAAQLAAWASEGRNAMEQQADHA